MTFARIAILLVLALVIGTYLIATTVLIARDGVFYIEQARRLSGLFAPAGRHLDFFVELDHILCDLHNSFAQRPRRENPDLVTVAENPPAYFAQTVHAKLDRG